ncbi:hypothetical protein BXZ70DRAFT_1066131 [Cristinia sonorae]|uniref:Uncharacterized protein n=1 Tax=Cristinia sonorae TaxID=1940300 RepID=A0A8K0UJU1_9AGAR|nr:hypothetical protein BXZ70DRAFT_1066131 [Cristinia sonorae]
MRFCSASAVRILTFISLLVLTPHSFAQSTADTTSTTLATTTTSTPVTTTTPTQPPPPPTPTDPPTTTTTPTTTRHTETTPTTTATPTTSTPTTTSTSTSSSTSSSSSSSSSSVSSSTVTSSSTLSSVTTSTPGTTLIANPTRNVATTGRSPTNTLPGIVHPSDDPEDADPESAGATKGTTFWDNKGAVAGTFFAVALAIIGLIVAAVLLWKRRRSRFRDEEDEIYFEKYHEPPVQDSGSPTLGNIPGLGDSSHDIATHARVDAYPDRAIHHGWAPQDDYAHPQAYGMEYPPNTGYGGGQAQASQYAYAGQAGVGVSAQQGYSGQNRTSPGPHPFADPNNVARRGAAPPVGHSYSQDSHSVYSGSAY